MSGMVEGHSPEVIVIGAACLDVKGRPSERMVSGTSNSGQVRISPGGAARNIAENLARLGVRATLLSVVGADDYARLIIEETAAAGVDMSYVRVASGVRSAIYLALLDDQGHLFASVDEIGGLDLLSPPYVYANRFLLEQAKMIAVDANLPTKTLGTVLALAKRSGVPVCMSTVSVTLARKVKRYLKDFAIVIGNLDEASVLCDRVITNAEEATWAAHQLVGGGAKLAIITLGAEGLVYATGTSNGFIPAIQCEVIDATGAGDALTASVIYGHLNQFPVDESLRLGVSAATLTLSCRETVCHDLTQDSLYQRMVI
jgi:pseudouridine kinase